MTKKRKNEWSLKKGKSYFLVYYEYSINDKKRKIKTRKPWIYQGIQCGGLLNIMYFVFTRTARLTDMQKAIPQYLFKEAKEEMK